jgi:molecular chaperone IbpA
VISARFIVRPSAARTGSACSTGNGEAQPYPPYNIERTGENAYRVTLAVAGFGEADIDIQAKENVLTVKGEKEDSKEESERDVLYRGIASRAFERRFQLADHVEVTGASLDNGLLHIDLVREIPEAMKPRKISIGGGVKSRQIDAKAA